MSTVEKGEVSVVGPSAETVAIARLDNEERDLIARQPVIQQERREAETARIDSYVQAIDSILQGYADGVITDKQLVDILRDIIIKYGRGTDFTRYESMVALEPRLVPGEFVMTYDDTIGVISEPDAEGDSVARPRIDRGARGLSWSVKVDGREDPVDISSDSTVGRPDVLKKIHESISYLNSSEQGGESERLAIQLEAVGELGLADLYREKAIDRTLSYLNEEYSHRGAYECLGALRRLARLSSEKYKEFEDSLAVRIASVNGYNRHTNRFMVLVEVLGIIAQDPTGEDGSYSNGLVVPVVRLYAEYSDRGERIIADRAAADDI